MRPLQGQKTAQTLHYFETLFEHLIKRAKASLYPPLYRHYKALVRTLQGPCTDTTRPLYGHYKARVRTVQGPCTPAFRIRWRIERGDGGRGRYTRQDDTIPSVIPIPNNTPAMSPQKKGFSAVSSGDRCKKGPFHRKRFFSGPYASYCGERKIQVKKKGRRGFFVGESGALWGILRNFEPKSAK